MKNEIIFVGIAAVSGGLTAPAGSSDARVVPQLQAYAETLPNSVVKVDMVPVSGGKVKVGAKEVEVKPFYIAQTETAWEAFDVFIKSGKPSKAYDQTEFAPDAIARPSKSYILPDLGWGHAGYPAINLSYTTVEMFCRWLSSETKKKYRVPTEAEWQLACEASWKGDEASIEESAWHIGNSNRMTHPVGKKKANALGLYDIVGNVGEWATDLEGKPVLCGGTFLDAVTGQTPTARKYYDVSWQATDPQLPKSRWWLSDGSFVGFRLVCEP
jgi:formylglycine-generating enzyme required for sulfatase activity